MFNIKGNFDGFIARYKIRLIAMVFHHSMDIDYYETFSLVIKPEKKKNSTHSYNN